MINKFWFCFYIIFVVVLGLTMGAYTYYNSGIQQPILNILVSILAGMFVSAWIGSIMMIGYED